MATKPVTTSTALIPTQDGGLQCTSRFKRLPYSMLRRNFFPFLTFFVRVGDRDCSDIVNLASTSKFWRGQLTQPIREQVFNIQKASSGIVTTAELGLFKSFMKKYFASPVITCIRCPELDADTDKLAEYRPRLLNLPNAVELNIDSVMVTRGFNFGKELADTLPNLKIFRLRGGSVDNFIEFILRHPQLETLCLKCLLTPAQLGQILQKCPNLQNLTIGGIYDEDFETVQLPEHKNLAHLKMQWYRSLDDLVEALTLFPNLQSLEITREHNSAFFAQSLEVITKRINSILPTLTLTLIEGEIAAPAEAYPSWRSLAAVPSDASERY